MTYYLAYYPPLGPPPLPRPPRLPGGNLVSQYKAGARSQECVDANRAYHKNYARRRRGKPIAAAPVTHE